MQALPANLPAFALDETGDGCLPMMRYRDNAGSHGLIRWGKPSVARVDDEVRHRDREDATRATRVLLLVPVNTDERAFHFLGPERYVRHERQQPMPITWKLEYRLPADLYRAFASVVA